MVGLLLLTHAPLGSAFVQAASHVFVANLNDLEAIDVVADQNLDEVNQLAREAIARLNDGAGVLVLTDITGGTPANCCSRLADPSEVAVVAGIQFADVIACDHLSP